MMETDVNGNKRLRPPNLGLFLAEGRGLFELNATLMLSPALLAAPRGDGHPVLVLPGLLATDVSTLILRRYLDVQGFSSHPWGLGRNVGGVYSMRDKLRKLLMSVHNTTGRRVSLVGWSLGGVYARDLALHMPDMVRYVVTMGSPFSGDITATNAKRVYEMVSGETIDDADIRDIQKLAGDLPVPTSSLFTRTDGIVNWETCLVKENDTAENIEITLASHIGIGVNAAALWAVADRLAQHEGEFHPFDRSGPFALAYARPEKFRS
ncbi:MAG: alpha/beta hydrolase [Afipia sp.]|nr:alpha/beta hydrolase [Afipia sp.]